MALWEDAVAHMQAGGPQYLKHVLTVLVLCRGCCLCMVCGLNSIKTSELYSTGHVLDDVMVFVTGWVLIHQQNVQIGLQSCTSSKGFQVYTASCCLYNDPVSLMEYMEL